MTGALSKPLALARAPDGERCGLGDNDTLAERGTVWEPLLEGERVAVVDGGSEALVERLVLPLAVRLREVRLDPELRAEAEIALEDTLAEASGERDALPVTLGEVLIVS